MQEDNLLTKEVYCKMMFYYWPQIEWENMLESIET